MASARRIGVVVSAALAIASGAAAVWLWPQVRRADAAHIEYLRRDVELGWLLLQAATPLFAIGTLTALGAALLAWRLARPRARGTTAPTTR
jgi:hypothetical protein